MIKKIIFLIILSSITIYNAFASNKIAILYDEDFKLSADLAKSFKGEMVKRMDVFVTDFDLAKKKQREALIILTENGRYSYTLALGSLATKFCLKNNIPGLFMLVRDPYAEGFIDPINQLPKGCMTGVSANLNPDKIFHLLSKVQPNGTAGFVYSEGLSQRELTKYEISAQTYSYKLAKQLVKNNSEVLPAFQTLAKNSTCYLSILDNLIYNRKSFMSILRISIQNKVPLIGLSHVMTEKGALMSFYSDNSKLAQQAALIIERLMEGEDVGEIPFSYPDGIVYSINKKTAKLMNIEIPQDIISQADQIIN